MEHKMRDLTAEERQKYIDAISTKMRSIAEECDESLQYEYDVLKLALVTLTAQPVKLPDLRQSVSGERYVWSDGAGNYKQDAIIAIRAAGYQVEGE